MDKHDKKFRERQLADFVKFSGLSEDETGKLLTRFAGICRQLDRINEEDNNTGKLSDLSKRRDELLMKQALEVATKLGCKLYRTHDGRGYAVRLIRPDGHANCMDGETWYVDL